MPGTETKTEYVFLIMSQAITLSYQLSGLRKSGLMAGSIRAAQTARGLCRQLVHMSLAFLPNWMVIQKSAGHASCQERVQSRGKKANSAVSYLGDGGDDSYLALVKAQRRGALPRLEQCLPQSKHLVKDVGLQVTLTSCRSNETGLGCGSVVEKGGDMHVGLNRQAENSKQSQVKVQWRRVRERDGDS